MSSVSGWTYLSPYERPSDLICVPGTCYLHPAQDDAEHPPQPEPDEGEGDDSPPPLPMPNFESRLEASFELQEGQDTSGSGPKTSFSKQHWHALH